MSGYLTKSPPESKIKVAQWHRRWFLLMDSGLVYPLADRYVRLEYYQSEIEAKRLADPKGTPRAIHHSMQCHCVISCMLAHCRQCMVKTRPAR